MAVIAIETKIEAAREVVFHTVSDAATFGKAVGGVTNLTFLSAVRSGLGTRFRQTRTQSGREVTMEFEVTEWVEGERLRIVNETHGTLWDTAFSCKTAGGGTVLTMRMETRSKPLAARLLMPFMIALFIRNAIAKDLGAVKAYCETVAKTAGG